jgi:hypothetical protein
VPQKVCLDITGLASTRFWADLAPPRRPTRPRRRRSSTPGDAAAACMWCCATGPASPSSHPPWSSPAPTRTPRWPRRG